MTANGGFGELMNNGGAITTWSWLKVLGGSLPLTAIAVATYPGNFGAEAAWIRVYTQETGNEIKEKVWDLSGDWRDGIPVVIS